MSSKFNEKTRVDSVFVSHKTDFVLPAGLRDLDSGLWAVEESCSVTGEGLDTGLEELCQLVNRRRKRDKRRRNKTK